MIYAAFSWKVAECQNLPIVGDWFLANRVWVTNVLNEKREHVRKVII